MESVPKKKKNQINYMEVKTRKFQETTEKVHIIGKILWDHGKFDCNLWEVCDDKG